MRKEQPKDQSSDSDLLHLSRKGDEDAFLILYRRHQGPVFRFALHMSGNRETAEEATQEVFLAMLSDGHQYLEARGCLEPYLIGMARNHVRKQIRTARAQSADDFESSSEQQTDSGEGVVDALSRKQELNALREAILKLPPNYREVIILCDLEGMDYSQAAAQLGCALGTIRSRLHRARTLLEAKLRRKDELRMREGCAV